jgi:uncharacterized membrane protein YfcA
MLLAMDTTQAILTALIFVWTGFVRAGLGFGGAALGLPLMLFIDDRPLSWLPMIGLHLLFFSGLTLRTRLGDVDWAYLRTAGVFIVPATLAGITGLLNLPQSWLLAFIYIITLGYAITWLANLAIYSHHDWVDKLLLVCGGYVAGTSLTGAPLLIAVFARHVALARLRNTLFVLWFILVTIKMTAFVVVGVDLRLVTALALLPVAALGHVLGLRTHEYMLRNDRQMRRVIGAALILISLIALWRLFGPA